MRIENKDKNDSLVMYVHMLISLFFLPFIIQETSSVRLIAAAYATFLVLRKDANSLPGLCILGSYLPNAYIIYFIIIALSIWNIKALQNFKVLNLFLILLLILPVVIYYIYSTVSLGKMSTGNAINQFQYYFSLFAFFYGVLIYKTINRTVFVGLFIVFIFLHALNVSDGLLLDSNINRLFFFIVPYLFVLWLTFLGSLWQLRFALLFLLIGILILTTINFDDSTFTILLSVLYASALYFLVKKRLTVVLKVITGPIMFAGLIAIVFYTIVNADLVEFDRNLVEMADINSYADLFTRFTQKWFVDRGTLWAGAWRDIVARDSYLPASVTENIVLQIDKREIEFGYHSHNIFLDLIRNNGYIIGVILSFVFIRFNILGAKVLFLNISEKFILVMFMVTIANNLVGGVTGIFVLLNSYALVGIGLTGVGHAYNISGFNLLSRPLSK